MKSNCYDKSSLIIDKNFSPAASFKVEISEVNDKTLYIQVSYTDGKYNVSDSDDGKDADPVSGKSFLFMY